MERDIPENVQDRGQVKRLVKHGKNPCSMSVWLEVCVVRTTLGCWRVTIWEPDFTKRVGDVVPWGESQKSKVSFILEKPGTVEEREI